MPIKHAVYLNLSRDHLDYHRNYESYLQAKRRLIENEELETLVFNADQPEFIDSLSNSNAKDVFQISNRNKSADIFYEIKNCDLTGNMKFIARTPWGEFDAEAKILTEYNIFNLLASLPYFYSVGGDVPSFFSLYLLYRCLRVGFKKLMKGQFILIMRIHPMLLNRRVNH